MLKISPLIPTNSISNLLKKSINEFNAKIESNNAKFGLIAIKEDNVRKSLPSINLDELSFLSSFQSDRVYHKKIMKLIAKLNDDLKKKDEKLNELKTYEKIKKHFKRKP